MKRRHGQILLLRSVSSRLLSTTEIRKLMPMGGVPGTLVLRNVPKMVQYIIPQAYCNWYSEYIGELACGVRRAAGGMI